MINSEEAIQFALTGVLGGVAAKTLIDIAKNLRQEYEDIEIEKQFKQQYNIKDDDIKDGVENSNFTKQSSMSKTAIFQGALDLLLLTGGAYGGYKLVDYVSKKVRKNAVLEEEAKAKEEYFKTLRELAKELNPKSDTLQSPFSIKTASINPLNALYWIASASLAATALSLIGTARASYDVGKRQSPNLNMEDIVNSVNSGKVISLYPTQKSVKQVVVSDKDKSTQDLDDLAKLLNDPSQNNLSVIKSASNIESNDTSKSIGINNIIVTVAKGFGNDVCKWASSGSPHDVFDNSEAFVRALKDRNYDLRISDAQKFMAEAFLASNKKCASVIVPYCALSILDSNTDAAQIAEGILKTASQEELDALTTFSNAYQVASQNEYMSKYASDILREFKVADVDTLMSYICEKHANVSSETDGKSFLMLLDKNSPNEDVKKLQKIFEFKF